jgi:transposase
MKPLSIREEQVFELRTAGLKNRQVAERLGITEDTVKSHVKQLINKGFMTPRLGGRDRIDGVEVVRIVTSRRLTPDQKLDQIRLLFSNQGLGTTLDWAEELLRKDDEAKQRNADKLDQIGQ